MLVCLSAADSRLPPYGWEVVQSAVHQTLDLIILVRVQASQPNLPNDLRETQHLLRADLSTSFSELQPTETNMGTKWGQGALSVRPSPLARYLRTSSMSPRRRP